VLIDENQSIGGSIPLPLVTTITPTGGPSFRSPKASYKISLSTHAWGELLLVFRGCVGSSQNKSNSYVQSKQDRDETYKALTRAIGRQAWRDGERSAVKEALRPSTAIAARKVGVDAIMTKNELRHRENVRLAESAFSSSANNAKDNAMIQQPTTFSVGKKGRGVADIDAFMGEAAELIKVIHKYVAIIERERISTTTAADNTSKDDTDKLVSMLQNMGMTSALSAKQTGSTYHTQLARQIVDFLKLDSKLSKCGGMMTLTDVYCLFNRARGSNMISPDDLLKAVDLMKELNLGLSKRTFESGVMVIQEDAFDDESMARRLVDLALDSMKLSHRDGGGGITAMDASKSLKISALLANEHLMVAERMGWICRDVTLEGVRFFPNLFVTGDFSTVSRSRSAAAAEAVEMEQALMDGEAGCYSAMVDSICSSLSQM
jgi:ESCRT-II complex subunit VPS36